MWPIIVALAVSIAPCTPHGTPERNALKHRSLDHYTTRPLTAAQLLARHVPTGQPHNSVDSVDPFEDEVWALPLAYVRRVKVSPDDCDLHLELSAGPHDARRFIAEIPLTDPEGQRDALRVVGLTHLGRGPHDFATPVPVSLAGYGFFDLHHQCARDPQQGCAHGSAAVVTLAELHPARLYPARAVAR